MPIWPLGIVVVLSSDVYIEMIIKLEVFRPNDKRKLALRHSTKSPKCCSYGGAIIKSSDSFIPRLI